MKRAAKRFAGLFLAVVLAVSAFGIQASALTINDKGVVTTVDVEWQNPTEILTVETQEKQFIMSARTEQGRVNNLYFSFPADGGVRIHGDDTGFFEPEECSAIQYSAEGAAIVMQANDTKVKVYTNASPWLSLIHISLSAGRLTAAGAEVGKNDRTNFSILTLNTKAYKNFELTLTYEQSRMQRYGVMFGLEPGEFAYTLNGSRLTGNGGAYVYTCLLYTSALG